MKLLAWSFFIASTLPYRWAPWLVQMVGDLLLIAVGLWCWKRQD